jgi:hypothetical protein
MVTHRRRSVLKAAALITLLILGTKPPLPTLLDGSARPAPTRRIDPGA